MFDYFGKRHRRTFTDEDVERLRKQPLCFSSGEDEDDVTATSRTPLLLSSSEEGGPALLNVEHFDFSSSSSSSGEEDDPVATVLFVHGVCSSAETKGVRRLAREARSRRARLSVLELEGHGLSSGARAVVEDLDRCAAHVAAFARRVVPAGVPFVLGGNSLGGALAARAAESLSREPDARLVGIALVAPAVGVSPLAVPPAPVVAALRVAARLFPRADNVPFTPLEDPSSYADPPTSTRNHEGRWPLVTSETLLDLTAHVAPSDVREGRMAMDRVPDVLLYAGEKDDVVPLAAVRDLHDKIRAAKKNLIVVPNAGHDLLYAEASGDVVSRQIFRWAEACVSTTPRTN